MKAKKSLGQHFLTSEAAVHHMVEASGAHTGDTVLEIGPGKGVLTKAILKTGASVVVVEKDERMIPLLSETFNAEIENKQLTIAPGDILTTDIEKIIKGPYSVVANIPYYITGEIMRLFLEHKKQPTSMTLLVQKEVALRIVAKDKKEGVLSLSVKVFGVPSLVSVVKRGSFFPIPNVDSAIIHIEVGGQKLEAGERDDFFKIVKIGLGHKRKILISNLKDLYEKDTLSRVFTELSLPLEVRGEDLSIDQWVELVKKLISQTA
ncbi:MAG: 16S rRNA (adenine(1518)-N(6)/adenine(1519)-N(6))-dimethyltransferase RsmA [Candidatus Zambryskibacteria bacterium]|nr:16S rRNA (adenine(1518)-N(6)/adenine(1519)-N(6))-dimethyltransferase RsmA [Candidatus Zambryskibacteria bacterium]